MRKGRVQTRDIPKYIQLLWESPGLIHQVHHIELTKDRQDCAPFTSGDEATEKACAGFLDALPLGISAAQRHAEMKIAVKTSDFWVMALLAIMSHAKTLTVSSDIGLMDIRHAALLERFGGDSTGGIKK